jgi:hypothetical protein
MLVILATSWEAEIRRFAVPGWPRQKGLQDPISLEKSWVWWHVPVIPAITVNLNRKIAVQASLGKKQDLISKITRAKGLQAWLNRGPT